ncbi:MAG: metallophosphoesterase [Phycisphaerae bacterium]|nr:metallophosphoesterase [Phycisphaerae bacterium]
MSDAFHNHGMTRRRFLNVSLAAAGGIIAMNPRWSRAAADPSQTRWAFLSDTHIAADPENNYRGFYPCRNLEKIVSQLGADLPEGVVVTGDLARLTGQMGDYENLRTLLMPLVGKRPMYLALGNHDDRAVFLDVFEDRPGQAQPVQDKHVVTVEAGPVRFILLDSLLATNKTPGLLGKAQRTWLGQYLANSDDKPVILFFHHTLDDGDGDLFDVLWLFDLIKPVRKVKAIVYGHSHEYRSSERDGIQLINLPSTAYNFGDNEPLGWIEAKLTAQGGEFTLHAVAGNTQPDGRVEGFTWRA